MSKTTQEKKEKKTAKKADKTEIANAESTKTLFCCNCKSHSNHPSFCRLNKKYVGRKAPACEQFK